MCLDKLWLCSTRTELSAELRRSRWGRSATLRRSLPGLLAAGPEARVVVGPELARVVRTLTHRELSLAAFRCDISSLKEREGLRWTRRDDLERVGIPSAMRALLAVASP